MKSGWDTSSVFEGGPTIDLTPLIDMVFMLLLFFILSTTFLKPAIEVDLPDGGEGVAEQSDSEVIIISIDIEGHIFADDQNITTKLASWMATVAPDTVLDFQVDRAAPFSAFVKVVDEAKKQGLEKFNIVTAPDAGDVGYRVP